MREKGDFLRTCAGASAFAGCVCACVLMHQGLVGSVPKEGASGGSRWTVRVDGWSFRFDGVDEKGSGIPMLPPGDAEAFASPYDDLIIRYATAAGIDWRLISAVIYEESRFRPDRVSKQGAYGLMQVRPLAAREVGAKAFYTPEENIRVGVQYLKRLEKLFADAPKPDHMALALAAYNMGPGHVADAQKLARRFGYDPLRWYDSMERVLPLLEQPAMYRKLPHGYAQGRATVAYVRRVLDRYARDRREAATVSRESPQSVSTSG